MEEENNMLDRKTWDEFRETGLLWFLNRMLHLFGWVICIEIDNEEGTVTNVYPARTKFHGFDYDTEEEGFKRVSEFMREYSDELVRECED